jgi:hypothetical protein
LGSVILFGVRRGECTHNTDGESRRLVLGVFYTATKNRHQMNLLTRSKYSRGRIAWRCSRRRGMSHLINPDIRTRGRFEDGPIK